MNFPAVQSTLSAGVDPSNNHLNLNPTGDLSTNNWFVALVSFGEGW
jgi:hypothetical protein